MKEVIIWGTGNYMKSREYIFDKRFNNIKILYYCNNEPKVKPNYINGVEVIDPEQIIDKIKENPKLTIIIASTFEQEIYDLCVQMGISDYVERFFITRNYNFFHVCDECFSYCAGKYGDYHNENSFTKREFLPCEIITKYTDVILNEKKEQIFAIKAFDPDTYLEFQTNEVTYNKILATNSFEYFRKKVDETLRIKTNKDIAISKRWNVNRTKKGKMVLHIICDSLAQSALENKCEELMPNTYHYFKNGITFENCYCCTDWTLPGVGTLETGEYPITHQLLDPTEPGCINGKILPEIFNESGWYTATIGSNWRIEPRYGYLKGLDRMVYQYGLFDGEGIKLFSDFMEMVRAFRDQDMFITLNLYDLHHNMKGILDIGEQMSIELADHFYNDEYKGKSVLASYDIHQQEAYVQKIKKLDYFLGVLYRFLDEEYGDSCSVIFSADHGIVPPLKLDRFHEIIDIDKRLADRMTRVPLYVKGLGIKKESIVEVVDNTVVSKIISLFSIGENVDNQMVHRVCKKDFAYNESIYPGQTYVAEVIDEKYRFYFETESVVSKECIVPQGRYKVRLFEKNSGNEIREGDLIKTYTEVVLKHIRKQKGARKKRVDLCSRCRKQNINYCFIPAHIEKQVTEKFV